MQKTLTFLVAFFAVLLLREEQKKPFVSVYNIFLHTLCFENKKKTNKKKCREMFFYQFVAHMQKIRQI